MTRVRSALVTTLSGTWWPTPRMRALTVSLMASPSQLDDGRAPGHAGSERRAADEIAAPHAAARQRIGDRHGDAGGRDVAGSLRRRENAAVRHAERGDRLPRHAWVEVVHEVQRDTLERDARARERLARRLGQRARR